MSTRRAWDANAETLRPRRVRPKSQGQQDLIDAIDSADVTFGIGPAGSGKAQPLSALVMTPSGPIPMGLIRVGDEICSVDGRVSRVLAVYPQGVKQVYEIEFDDGSKAEACAEHLWAVYDHRCDKQAVLSTSELMGSVNYRKTPRSRYSVQSCGIVHFDSRDVPIEPYLLGVLLGDGSFRMITPRISTADDEISAAVASCLDDDHRLKKVANRLYDYCIVRKGNRPSSPSGNRRNGYRASLQSLGLDGLMSHEKFIPHDYLHNNVAVRLAVLQGLMDTDGTVAPQGCSQIYTTTSPDLADGVRFLVESLGGKCKVRTAIKHFTHKGVRKRGKLAYNLTFRLPVGMSAFRLSRKRDAYWGGKKYGTRRFIRSITPVREAECQCILIDDPSHLYLTDNFIVTHNTHVAVAKAVECLVAGDVNKIVLIRPCLGLGRTGGYLPGSLEEKMGPYLRPLLDELENFFPTKDDIARQIRDGKIELTSLEFIRGRTFKHAFVILDEAQNATYDEMKAFLTRLGEGSLYVITGDLTKSADGRLAQSDLRVDEQGALEHYADRLGDIVGVEVATLTTVDVVRHPLVRLFLERGL
jgi:phosphate starvation-inducible protein PhoH